MNKYRMIKNIYLQNILNLDALIRLFAENYNELNS